ncbi:MAG: host-nuclease inhibitor Gam family protein [Halanaerobiales bacterium]
MPEKAKEKEEFVIDNDNRACWALKKIKALKEEIEEKEELAESQIYQVEKWLEREKAKRESKIANLESMLYDYGQLLKQEKPKLKTHSLPFGKLKFRSQRPKWEYGEKLKEAVENNIPEAIKTEKKVDKKKLKKLIKADDSSFQITPTGKVVNTTTGEVVEGITVKERGEKFSVKAT